MTNDKFPQRKDPTKLRRLNDFRQNIQRRNPAVDQRRIIPVTQHRS